MIREATIADLPLMAEPASLFYSSSEFLQGFNIEKFVSIWTQFLTAKIGIIFLSTDGESIKGALGGIVHDGLYGGPRTAEEFFWFIDPSFRGDGVRLYRKFEDWAKRQKADEIQMVHLLDSMPEKLSRFYVRNGYKPIETRYSLKLT